VPVEVGNNSAGVALSSIYRNMVVDQGFPIGIPTSLDGALHALDYALWAARQQSARDTYDAPWGTTFTVSSCATTNNSGVITTSSSLTSVKRGMYVSGTGIPVGAQVMEPPATGAIVISPAATATGTVTLTFYPINVGETVPRFQITSSTIAKATSGTLVMSAIQLPINATISNFNILFGTTGDAGPTNQWMALYDNQRNLLAISADQTSTAITASTVVTYAVATLASGAGTTYVTPYSGLYYVGFLLATANAPTFTGVVGSAIANALVPINAGTSSTGLTTPSTFPTTAGTITATTNRLYMYLT
jgi:hypothetical protein